MITNDGLVGGGQPIESEWSMLALTEGYYLHIRVSGDSKLFLSARNRDEAVLDSHQLRVVR